LHGFFLQESNPNNIRRVLAFGTVHITVHRTLYPVEVQVNAGYGDNILVMVVN